MVVLTLVAGEDAVDAGADHLPQGVLDEVRVTAILKDVGEGSGETDALVKLPDRKQAGVAGELARGALDNHGEGKEGEGLLPSRLYTHGASPREVR